jgi:hypothetical protein
LKRGGGLTNATNTAVNKFYQTKTEKQLMYLYNTPYKLRFSSPSRSLELFRVNSTMVKKPCKISRQMTDNSDEIGEQILPSRNKNYVRFEVLSSMYNHFLKTHKTWFHSLSLQAMVSSGLYPHLHLLLLPSSWFLHNYLPAYMFLVSGL